MKTEEEEETKEWEENKDKNNSLHDIHKSVQFYNGLHLKPEMFYHFQEQWKTCSMESFQKKKKARANSFMLKA